MMPEIKEISKSERDEIGIQEYWIVTEHEDVVVWMANVPRKTEIIGVTGGIIILSCDKQITEIGINGLLDWTTFAEISRYTLMVCSVKEKLDI